MKYVNVIGCLALCILFHLCSALVAENTTPKTITNRPGAMDIPKLQVNTKNVTESRRSFTDFTIPEIIEQFHQLRAFSEKSGLSDDPTHYLNVFLTINALMLFAMFYYFVTPQLRICSWFGSCDSTAGQYPAAVAHNLQDPQILQYSRRYKRSLQYIGPILKTLSDAFEKYEHSETDKRD